jgi:hypothetical protein
MAGRKGEKHWRDALMIAVNEVRAGDPSGKKNLRAIADKCVELALEGDMAAIKEIGDRMDGRAVQAIANDDDEPFRVEDSAARDLLAAFLASRSEKPGGTSGGAS